MLYYFKYSAALQRLVGNIKMKVLVFNQPLLHFFFSSVVQFLSIITIDSLGQVVLHHGGFQGIVGSVAASLVPTHQYQSPPNAYLLWSWPSKLSLCQETSKLSNVPWEQNSPTVEKNWWRTDWVGLMRFCFGFYFCQKRAEWPWVT